MPNKTAVYRSIAETPWGIGLQELLAQYPELSRSTVQRLISEMIESGEITALGAARSQKYHAANTKTKPEPRSRSNQFAT